MANGVILTLLKNVRPEAPPKTLSFVATHAEAVPRETGGAVAVFRRPGVAHRARQSDVAARRRTDQVSRLAASVSASAAP